MNKIILLIIVAVCLKLPATAYVDKSDSTLLPIDSCIRIGKLDNGLTYYLRYNNWPEESACFYLAQRVGSLQEEETQRGLAHFLEHMCFNGSEHFPKSGDVVSFCERLGVQYGAELNAYTSLEETVYNIDDVPTSIGQERLDSCLLVLYDWANGLTLDSAEIEKERRIIHEEWRMDRTGYDNIKERQLPRLFPDGNRYGCRRTIGLMSVVDSFPHHLLREYYEKWNNPENQCVIVVGDIDIDHTEAKIKELFSSIQTNEVAGQVKRIEVADHEGIIFSIDKDKEYDDNGVTVIYKRQAYTAEERKYLWCWKEEAINNIACYLLSERLRELKRRPDTPFLSASAYVGSYMHSSSKGAFMLDLGCEAGKQEASLEAMMKEYARVAVHGFTESEFERYKKSVISSLDNTLQSLEKRNSSAFAEEYYNNYLNGSEITSVEDYVRLQKQIIEELTLDTLNKQIRELVPNEETNMVIVSWNQEKEDNSYPTEESLLEAYRKGRNAETTPWVDNFKHGSLLNKQPKAGRIVKEEYCEDVGYSRLTLSNGATVLMKKTGIDKSQVLFKAYGGHGWTGYPECDDASIAFMNDGCFGINGLDGPDLAKMLADKIVNLGAGITQTRFEFTGSYNPKDEETFMQLLHSEFTLRSIDREGYERKLRSFKDYLSTKDADKDDAFSDSIKVTNNGHHPRFKLLDEDDIDKFDVERMLQIWNDQTANARNYTFLFVGNYNEDTIGGLIEKYIASLPSKKKVKKNSWINTWRTEDTYCHFNREMDEPETRIDIDWQTQALPYTLENETKAIFAYRILDRMYDKVVREENSAAYSCGADMYMRRGGEGQCKIVLNAYCTMDPEKSDSVVAMMKQEFRNLSENIDEELFSSIKENLLKSFEEAQKTSNGFWISNIWRKERYNYDAYTRQRKIIEEMAPQDIKDFMRIIIDNCIIVETMMQPKTENK